MQLSGNLLPRLTLHFGHSAGLRYPDFTGVCASGQHIPVNGTSTLFLVGAQKPFREALARRPPKAQTKAWVVHDLPQRFG